MNMVCIKNRFDMQIHETKIVLNCQTDKRIHSKKRLF